MRLSHIFLLDDRQRNFVEGRAERPVRPVGRYGPAMVIRIVFAVLSLVVGLSLFLTAASSIATWQQFSTNAVETNAVITDKSMRQSGFGGPEPYIEYRYTIAPHGDEIVYNDRARMSMDEYERLEPGMTVLISYLPASPDTSKPAGQTGIGEAGMFTIVAFCFTTLSIVILVGSSRRWVRNSRLVRKGKLIFGKLTGYSIDDYNDEYDQLVVRYEFTSPQNEQTITASHKKIVKSGYEIKMPVSGTAVALLYLDDRSHLLL